MENRIQTLCKHRLYENNDAISFFFIFFQIWFVLTCALASKHFVTANKQQNNVPINNFINRKKQITFLVPPSMKTILMILCPINAYLFPFVVGINMLILRVPSLINHFVHMNLHYHFIVDPHTSFCVFFSSFDNTSSEEVYRTTMSKLGISYLVDI